MITQLYHTNSKEERKFASLSRNTLPQKDGRNVVRNKSIKSGNIGIKITYNHQEPPKRTYSNIIKDPNDMKNQPQYLSRTLQPTFNVAIERKSHAPTRVYDQEPKNIRNSQVNYPHRRQVSQINQKFSNQNKNQSQVQKLTRICEQFYHENQKLKYKLKQNQQNQHDNVRKRNQQLQNQLKRLKQLIDSRNRQILQMGGKINIVDIYDSANGYERQSFPKLANPNIDNRVEKLTQQLRSKQYQLMKYMHKQSQYIQIYVQKQQLQAEIRNLLSLIESQGKQLQQAKYKSKSKIDISQKQCHKCTQNLQSLKRMNQFNSKLTDMLNLSSAQIQRLNSLLKAKVTSIQNAKAHISDLKQKLVKKQSQQQQNIINLAQIHTFKNINQQPVNKLSQKKKQLQYLIKQANQQHSQKLQIIKQHQLNIETLQRQNKNLQDRLNDQVSLSFQLKQIITNLQNELKSKTIQKKEVKQVEVNTQKQIQQPKVEEDNGISDVREPQFSQKQQHKLDGQNTTHQNFHRQETDQKLTQFKNLVIEMQQTIDNSCLQIQQLSKQNQQLSRVVVKQNDQIVKLRQQNQSLKIKGMMLQKNLQNLQLQKSQLPVLISRIKQAEDKLLASNHQYNKLLHQVQSSCSETESVHKQLQQMIEQKQNSFGVEGYKIAPMSTRSQAGDPFSKTSKKLIVKDGNGLEISQAKSNKNISQSGRQWDYPKEKDKQSTLYSRFQFKNNL